jgi:hypothetical protein
VVRFKWLDGIQRSRLTKKPMGNSPTIVGGPDPKERGLLARYKILFFEVSLPSMFMWGI